MENMKNVINGDGRMERFSRRKIISSLETLGLDRKKALQIAKAVRHHEGITTEEIKRKIASMLRSIDSRMARRFIASRDLKMKETASGIWGLCLLTEKDMERIDVKIGQEIEACDGRNHVTLRAYAIDHPYYRKGSVYISDHDLDMLDHGFGSRIMLRKHVASMA